MITKENKMIIYRCDLCKMEIEKNRRIVLTSRSVNPGSGDRDENSRMWDLCVGCVLKVIEQLGEGRSMRKTVVTPTPYSRAQVKKGF